MSLLGTIAPTLATSGITSGIQFGLNTASGLINQAFARRNAKIQANYNKELMDYQMQLQQQQIDEQNAYNSPLQQMQRYQEAGLNPNLIYGQGNNGNQTTVAKPQSSAPANYQQPVQELIRGVDFFKTAINIQDLMNKTRESKARADMMEKQSHMYDSFALTDAWKRQNMFPLYLAEQGLKNQGLGYDNNIKWWRYQYTPAFLRNELLYQHERNFNIMVQGALNDMELQHWLPRYKLSYARDLQGLNNMKAQNLILNYQRYGLMPLEYSAFKLRNKALQLSNDFDAWKFDWQKRNELPFGSKNSYGFSLPVIGGGFNWTNYYE